MSNQKSNYYQILGVERDASAQEIKRAYARVRRGLKQEARGSESDELALVENAYEALSSPQRRSVYDSLLEAAHKPPITVTVQSSGLDIPLSDVAQLAYILVELRSTESGEQATQPLNLCLVIDRSSSMRGRRLDQVKRALQMFLEKLSPADVLSVVTFSDWAEVLLPARHVGEHKAYLAAIAEIQASGGTEIMQGLTAGMQQLRWAPLDEYNNHLLLLTDGQTYGDAIHCLELANAQAGKDITINAFGIGSDWDDQFLDALVAPSGGSVAYIDSPSSIVSVMEQRLQGWGTSVARQVRLKQNWPGRVDLLDAFRLTPYAKPLPLEEDEIVLGDIEGRTPLVFLLEFSIEAHPIPTRIRIPLAFEADFPASVHGTFKETVGLTLLAEIDSARPPEAVIRAVRLLTLYRLNEQAWREIESGDIKRAAQRMGHLSTRFLEAGEPLLAGQADREARRLASTGKLSAEGRKQLKYGTRALMGKTIQLEWND